VRSQIRSLLGGSLAVFALLVFAHLAFAQDPSALIYGMKDGYQTVEDYKAVFIRQETVDGKLTEPEEIALEFKRPFMVKMRWLKGPKKGRKLVFVEGENNGKILVSLEGLIGRFVQLLRLDPDGALARQGGHHTIRQAGLGNLVDSLIAVTRTADEGGYLKLNYLGEEVIGGRTAYIVERIIPKEKYEAPRTLISIDKETHLPVKVLRFDAAGELLERYEYDQLEINQDISLTDFRMKDKFEKTPSEEAKDAQAAYQTIQTAVRDYTELHDYTAVFHKQERIGAELFPEELFEIKFVKPFYLYLKILKGRYEGTILYYSPDRPAKKRLIVQPGGVVGTLLSKVNLDQIPVAVDAAVVTKGNRHLLTEFGIGYFLERYREDFDAAMREKDFYIELSDYTFDGDPGTRIELILKNRKKLPKYYAYRTLVFFSKKWKLPTEIKVFNEDGELVEYYGYHDFKADTGLTPQDLDPDRPAAKPTATA